MLAGTQFAHVGFTDQAAVVPAPRHHHPRARRAGGADVLACIAEHRIPSIGGVAPQMAPSCPKTLGPRPRRA